MLSLGKDGVDHLLGHGSARVDAVTDALARAKADLAVGVAEHGVRIGHGGHGGEPHAEVAPAAVQLAGIVVDRGQAGECLAVALEVLPGLILEIAHQHRPEGHAHEHQTQENQRRQEGKEAAEGGFHAL